MKSIPGHEPVRSRSPRALALGWIRVPYRDNENATYLAKMKRAASADCPTLLRAGLTDVGENLRLSKARSPSSYVGELSLEFVCSTLKGLRELNACLTVLLGSFPG